MQRLLPQELYAKHRALFAKRAFFCANFLEFAGEEFILSRVAS